MTTLVELGDRYWALGLPAAAKSAFARAHGAAAAHDAVPARRLAELALAVGDTAGARRHAAEVARRDPGPSARVLLGQAQLVAGEAAAARMSFAAAIEAETGVVPEASTSGGTSDARFLKALCPVIEFGLSNATMHKRDEAVALADLDALARVYTRIAVAALGA